MSDSPVVVIFDAEGNEVTVEDGGSLPSTSSGIPIVGKDGSTARFVQVDADGKVAITGTVTGTMSTGTISGTVTANQGLEAQHENRWPVGISDGTDFVGTQANPIKVGDDFSGGEILAQQNGANAVLTFNFSSAVHRVFVESSGVGLTSRADPFGGTPTSTTGIPCRDEDVLEIKVTTTIVRVYAPTGAIVNVWGLRR